ncbi:hypothetical protein CkaCkLH20_09238 [Colletotrichum karsti]|uniref:Large ribosomal subunit protein mL50 n=1 Tax=Colletotrichum karsti TaxID=1095194 RepID=A0A9P6I084_9PEZI|nr:uncharacterized protein CkaCkLH20_09238 [Colletotrichum karsti]KAF9873425.1 hypothetical protein CkaCkLH20_09238 [Colletotrichum karsti]
MRRVPRLSQPLLAAAPSRCTCASATLPIAARRALSTTTTLSSREGVRNALWSGEAPGPKNVDDPAAMQELKEEKRRLDQEEAQAEIAVWEAKRPKVKGRKNRKAKDEDSAITAPTAESLETEGYVPAKTIDELEEIGGLDGWWEQRWSAAEQYVGFSSRSIANKIEDGAVCEALVRQALVETLVLSQLDKEALKRKWVPGDREDFNRATAISLEAIGAEGAVPEAQKEAAETIVQMLQGIGRAETTTQVDQDSGHEATRIPISADEAQVLVQSWDPKWKAISLQDPLLKFALHKRVFQLTGHYIHDAKLAQMKTVGHLIAAVVKPPKPAKVIEAIYAQGSLPELPNVKLSHRRITPIDKEKAVGRWKVIQEELEKRGLPVTGHEHLPRPVQRDWIQGKN